MQHVVFYANTAMIVLQGSYSSTNSRADSCADCSELHSRVSVLCIIKLDALEMSAPVKFGEETKSKIWPLEIFQRGT
jgi:hypothetical protein